jgi:hypothetical protein
MSWEDEQFKRTKDGRLLLSCPELVFQELKEMAREVRNLGFLASPSDELERMLIERNAPLINLGLACYGTNEAVYKALYKHGREVHADANDEMYRRGLRMGCLSNATIRSAGWHFDFPRDLLGEEEVQHIFEEADFSEAEALVCNPQISDKLLEQLYKREGPFAKVADERLAQLVSSSGKNERLNTNNDDDESPDLGHYSIHEAILQLVETAPINPRWMSALYHLLDTLNPEHTARTESLEPTLSRWKDIMIKGHDGKVHEGLFAHSISFADEFRCLIAAHYGAGLEKSKLQLASKSEDVAKRAAYYANGNLTANDMKAGVERDKDAFVYSAMYNGSIIIDREKRLLFESMLSHEWRPRYLKLVNFARERYRSFFQDFIADSVENAPQQVTNEASLAMIEAAMRVLGEKVDKISARFQQFQSWFLVAAIAVAIGFYFRR